MPTATSTAPSPSTGRRPGRPRSADGPAVTREQVVDRALQVIARRGYEGLSLRGLARDLGVSLGAVQHHVATKDDLWHAAVDRLLGDVGPRAAPAPDERGAQAATTVVAARIRSLVASAAASPGLSVALWNDRGDGADERLAHLGERAAAWIDPSRRELEAAVAAGVVRPIAPEAFLALVSLGVSSIAGAPEAVRALFDLDLTDPAERARLADGLTDVLLHGLLDQEDHHAHR